MIFISSNVVVVDDKKRVFLLCLQNGMTAIHVAALFGQTEIVQEFLSRAPQSATLVSEVKFLYT